MLDVIRDSEFLRERNLGLDDYLNVKYLSAGGL